MTAATMAPTGESRGQRTARIMAEKPVIALLVVLAILYVITGVQDPTLFAPQGIRSVLLLACPLAILAAVQTVCMLTGGIDLSAAMIANFAAYVSANNAGLGPIASLGFAFLVGGAIGLINGIGVGVFRVNPLIMTLGMSSVLVGVITVGIVGDGFLSGSTTILSLVKSVGGGTLFGPIPLNSIVLALVAAILILGLGRTGLGRSIYATGDNESAGRLAGVRSWQVLIAVYVIAGLLAALAGLMFSGISGSVGPDQTNSYLLPSVAAAVIGGTSILGGTGGFGGTIVGALILTVLNRLLLGLETSDAVRQIIYGAIVLALAWFYVRVTGQRAD
ncbi:MAG: transporter permease [Naasia sp.]|jgi:ribose transport system permease protein|uniref:ABC transporter permease n=1 Tax=Naasia sp. TaxID=2546198 RepID=UPI00261774E1|nr:ABC transporter permease [Naasia sp.]MCU1570893.1 transporter permease [Naasia sp.]